MRWVRIVRSATATTVAVLLALAGTANVAQAASSASLTKVKARAIYSQSVGETTQRDLMLGSISSASAWSGKLWTRFLNEWGTINKSMTMHTTVPGNVPSKGHVFVVLGSALTSAGKITTTLERRLKLAVQALDAYPASKVVVTGGKPKSGKTEAAVMKAWLLAKGVKSSRVLTEDKSSNTISNAKNTMAMLAASNTFTSYTLITDAGHMRRSSVLFRAATVQIEEKRGKAWGIKPVANLVYPDMVAGKGPLSAASVAYTASEVASLFGVLSEYRALTKKPPKAPALTSLSLTPPKKLKYQVGAKLSTTGMVAMANYDKGAYTQVVTGKVKVTGFSSAKVGKGKATVSYTAGGVTKKSSFTYSVVKAPSKIKLKLSTSKVKRSKTRVTVKTTITTASKALPTGTVKFYLDGKLRKTVKLTKANKGVAKYTYPKISKTGKHQLTVKYSGTSKLTSAKQTATVKVTK